ncbi:uncharacterized protein DUF1446 [Knoellia remsis]|uniref:Uncharacterized protein DUF1446 n=1 Tax=Knoellia remsis TaxID=407159 RepID=A0A2T0V0Z0_9MICO|nr:acyclic terpene utilization AtuA family protein [Knoellia remsis]PRY63826.1 uncharacterized protein DUF1446 [Knoellia remsis]
MSGPIRIGNCSGFYGDRFTAMREMLEGGDLDVLTGDYLAELTMLILGRDRMKDPELGYAKTFLAQLTDSLGVAKERGVRIVANAGGLNPAGLAEKIRIAARDNGIDVRVAHVEGDDLMERADELGLGTPLTANAYLGAFGIARALEAGADVVVTGRVTDASLVVGPAIWRHGWGRGDLDALAGAVVAGHVIECGTQATGGNFSGLTRGAVAAPFLPGFPIAEVASDGSSVITKHPGTGGEVSVDTVTAQLLYEIQGPWYAGPDVSVDLTSVRLTQEGTDRVGVRGVVGAPPPQTLKVGVNTFGGFRNTAELVLTGLDIEGKAELVKAQVEAALDAMEARTGRRPSSVEWHLDRTDSPDPATQAAATSILRLSVASQDPEAVGRAFSDIAVQLALASYAGFTLTRPPASGVPFGVHTAAFVEQAEVPHTVVHADGTREDIPAPTAYEQLPGTGNQSGGVAHGIGNQSGVGANGIGNQSGVRRVALGEVAYARAGDKGGDANVGVWVPATFGDGDAERREAAYEWLVDLLTPERVRELLPEAAGLDVEVHAFANLAGVNIVLHGLLGEGVAASTRFDPQGKAVGEWLRARVVDVPTDLLDTTEDA